MTSPRTAQPDEVGPQLPLVLAETEKRTLNAAMQIILNHTAPEASWQFSAHNWERRGHNLTYSTQHPGLGEWKTDFAERVQLALNCETEIPSPEELRQERIEALRKQLSDLEGELAQ